MAQLTGASLSGRMHINDARAFLLGQWGLRYLKSSRYGEFLPKEMFQCHYKLRVNFGCHQVLLETVRGPFPTLNALKRVAYSVDKNFHLP